MLNSQMQDALNQQMVAEMYSGYLYLSMAAYFQDQNLDGFAHWMQMQAQEEMGHAMKFYGFIFDRGGKAEMGAIDAPPADWESPQDVFEAVLEHERKVTRLIEGLVDQARELDDKATENFLQWFVKEQVEEEASADQVLQQLRMIGDAKGPLFMLNSVLGRRGGE